MTVYRLEWEYNCTTGEPAVRRGETVDWWSGLSVRESSAAAVKVLCRGWLECRAGPWPGGISASFHLQPEHRSLGGKADAGEFREVEDKAGSSAVVKSGDVHTFGWWCRVQSCRMGLCNAGAMTSSRKESHWGYLLHVCLQNVGSS